MTLTRLAIIGSGIAGTMSASYFRSLLPVVFDSSEEAKPLIEHKAVMRIRDPSTALLLGCRAKEVTVYKMVYLDGAITDRPSIKANNLYSLKMYGELGSRSLQELGAVKRFILIDDPANPQISVSTGMRLVGVKPGTLTFMHRGSNQVEVCYDACISTIPMPAMMKAARLEMDDQSFSCIPIYVLRGTLRMKSSVHQTVYFPNSSISTYRATIEGQTLLIESAADHITLGEMNTVLGCFGLSELDIEHISWHKHSAGKMISIDEDYRKSIIFKLTDDLNIYSVGRFAVWKPKRMDQVAEDLSVVARMISAKSRSYDIQKERM